VVVHQRKLYPLLPCLPRNPHCGRSACARRVRSTYRVLAYVPCLAMLRCALPSIPFRAYPCRAVPCHAVPCRALPCTRTNSNAHTHAHQQNAHSCMHTRMYSRVSTCTAATAAAAGLQHPPLGDRRLGGTLVVVRLLQLAVPWTRGRTNESTT
jgi:hypothetical protein